MKIPFYHALVSIIMMILISTPLLLFGVENAEWIGAVFSSSFYYGREVTQRQDEAARRKGVTRSSQWYIGWLPLTWDTNEKKLELFFPLVSCLLLAILIKGRIFGWISF